MTEIDLKLQYTAEMKDDGNYQAKVVALLVGM